MAENQKAKTVKLVNMPLDVEEYLLEIQGAEKIKCRCVRSKEFIVYLLIREHREMTALKQSTKKT